MALVLKDRVLENSTSTGTGSFTLTGAQTGYQSFSAIGNGNTTYYTIQGKNADGTLTGEWEVGVGTWSTGGTLSRDTVLSNSLGTTAKIVFSAGAKDVFCDFPAQYASEGFIYQAAGTPITLIGSSARRYSITGSGGQTIKLPDATTLVAGTQFQFDNNQSSGAITVNNNSNTLVVSVPSGGYVILTLQSNSIAAGSWDRHDITPSNVSWSTNTFDYPGSITSATWNGNTIAVNRGGTGTTTSTGTGSVVLNNNPTITGVLTADDLESNNNLQIQTAYVNGTTIGAVDDTFSLNVNHSNTVVASPSIILGNVIGNSTVSLSDGATDNGFTNTIYVGTNGVTGSTTDIRIGSVGGTSTTILNGTVRNSKLTPSQAVFTNSTRDLVSVATTGSGSVVLNDSPTLTGTTTIATLATTAMADTGSLARNAGLTANTTVNATTTYTTGGITLPSQTAATGSVWRVKAYGQYQSVSSVTSRQAQIACFWGNTQLTAIVVTVVSGLAQTTGFLIEFELTATSTTAIWTTGMFINRIQSSGVAVSNNALATAASTTVSSGAQTLDLRVSMSTAAVADSWIISQVTMERLK